MIVTCERCASQFELDECKISAEGVRVRCSRCEHAFIVESPEQADADHARDLVVDLLGTASSEVAPDPLADPDDRISDDTRQSTETNGSIDLDALEDDWEFNEEVATVASPTGDVDELTAAREAVDDLLGGVSNPELSVPIEPDTVSEPSTALDLDLGPDGLVDVGSDPEIELLGGDEPAPLGDAALADADLFGEDDEPNSKPAGDFEPADVFEAEVDESVSDDVDDPANWDLFDSEPDGTAEVAVFESQLDSTASEALSASPIGVPRVAPPGVTGVAQSKTRIIGAAGWAVLAALVITCLNGGLSIPIHQPQPWSVESASAPGFELRGVSARWIDNAIVGRVYVVSGKLRRSQSSTAGSVTPLVVQLVDANGQLIERSPAPVGPAIPEKSLRETSPAELAELQRNRAEHFAATAKNWLSFAAVVPGLPDTAERFEFSPLTPGAGS